MRLLILFLLSLTGWTGAAAQGTVRGVLAETSTGPYVAGSVFEVTLRLAASPGTSDVSTSGIAVAFDGAALAFPSAPTQGPTGTYQYVNYSSTRPSRAGGTVSYSSRVTRSVALDEVSAIIEVFEALDAYALAPPAADYALLWAALPDGTAMSISALPALEALRGEGSPVEVPLDVAVVASGAPAGGSFRLTWPEAPEMTGSERVVLVDTEAGVEVDLSAATEYVFTVEAPSLVGRAAEEPALASDGGASPAPAEFAPGSAARGGSTGRFVLRYDRARTTSSEGADVPVAFDMSSPYPNPSRDSARLRYALPSASEVEVEVYQGNRITQGLKHAHGRLRPTPRASAASARRPFRSAPP